MRYGIFSDIHGNLEALEAVFARMEELGVERRVCLGDLVGYCANPNECVDLIRQKTQIVLLGNHDSVALGRESSENFNFFAKRAIEWTKENLKPETFEFLDKLDYEAIEGDFCFVHASPRAPASWSYISTLEDSEDAFKFNQQRICFVGHTHWPSLVKMDINNTQRVCESFSYTLEKDCRLLVNVGSVGQPRDRNPMASFCICDSDTMSVEVMRVPYDLKKTQEKMRRLKFADFLITRLEEGR